MTPTRRSAIKGIGAASGLAAISGTAIAAGEQNDGFGETEDEEDPADEPAGLPETGIRVAHFSPDAPNVDVYLAGDAVLEDVPYRTVSGYLAVDAGTYPVEITAAGDPETVVFDQEVTIEQGTIYSAYAIGLLEPPENLQDRAFEVLIEVDRGPTEDT
ncbi:DUF4397 domain-containing protein [Halostagnicola sp. A-GB9-2]|uniref:DUF4397 domain-containing protein n=1 Tax=Halostagnicola sp. A-GB9-2 TaxID=3048066 RepID=UPI0024BF58C9|nr:DUF4397 domain-containing protein [Halostagnicola sp. A-GB9-2]MDJ1433505.1 DUF4397 domain-containing protein [Halostagnicola sp. A-GB9-2]